MRCASVDVGQSSKHKYKARDLSLFPSTHDRYENRITCIGKVIATTY